MSDPDTRIEVLIVTGMSGAGRVTVMKTLEDLGWEVIDNLPMTLLAPMLETEQRDGRGPRPLALGLGTQTRDFDPETAIAVIDDLRATGRFEIGVLFLDCATHELERRYDETRRRHPMAADRPARDGIVGERSCLAPLRAWANRLVDTTALSAHDLAADIRRTFARDGLGGTTLSIQSFGFARGLPADADLVFDMRFLRNPHWDDALRPLTGRDPAVAAYVAADPAYEEAVGRVEDLLLLLLPRYRAEGKPYVTIAFGCTGGKHRSVHVAERVAKRLREAGFSPTIVHRDLASAPQDALEGRPRPMTTRP
ncbi:nucleotide-binding protein [Sphingomonas sp. Leaf412]|uniref:RNase adapter RapZ n=1 Tax=Sphingomonas sp. Leaf412 TaxID=1736370 RepID=UPI0006FA7B3B|nr:RNase adapter RapZ [Sphingomonas sp. Leaf412]KQT32622.1 nucleotide-binding protein [Sphingomonas sp. Leaf412]